MQFAKPQLSQIPSLIANLLLPFVSYTLLRHSGFSDSNALVITAVFPGLKVTFDLAKSRRVDVLGCIVLWEIALVVILNACFHNARLILLKGPIQVAVVGVACFVSLVARFPLAGIVALLLRSPALHIGGNDGGMLRSASPRQLRIVTMAFGVASIVDAVVRSFLIFSLTTGVYIIVSRVIQWIFFGSLFVWTLAFLRPSKEADELEFTSPNPSSRGESISPDVTGSSEVAP
jgi:hypothetical protein